MEMLHQQICEFSHAYLQQFWKLQLWQWENYAEKKHHDLNQIDQKIFALVQEYQEIFGTMPHPNDQPWEKFIKLIISQLLVEKAPEIARLRNRLDNFQNYSEGLEKMERENVDQYRLALARRMHDDVLDLMKLREEKAQQLGYGSYVDLILEVEGLSKKELIFLLEGYLQENLSTARELIQRYQISWTNWFMDLKRISQIETSAGSEDQVLVTSGAPLEEGTELMAGVSNKVKSQKKLESDPNQIVQNFLTLMDFTQVQDRIKIYLNDDFSGYAGAISVPTDIRILTKPVKSVSQWLTLYHELGHALAHTFNKGAGLFKTWNSVFDESMAVVMEQVASKIMLNPEEQRQAEEVRILKNCRIALNALYEFALWQEPDRAEDLYLEYYSKLGLEIEYPELWVLDSFRSVDPVYIHTYVVGDVVAKETIKYLEDHFGYEYHQWGQWLKDNYYYDGRRRSLKEKVNDALGHVL